MREIETTINLADLDLLEYVIIAELNKEGKIVFKQRRRSEIV